MTSALHKHHIHRYLRLCEDEFAAARRGVIDDGLWDEWHSWLDSPDHRARLSEELATIEAKAPFEHLRACLSSPAHHWVEGRGLTLVLSLWESDDELGSGRRAIYRDFVAMVEKQTQPARDGFIDALGRARAVDGRADSVLAVNEWGVAAINVESGARDVVARASHGWDTVGGRYPAQRCPVRLAAETVVMRVVSLGTERHEEPRR